jgi:two-component system catabolic regulation response regulator CreB
MTQNTAPGLSPAVATALGISAEPLEAPPLQLWPAEGQCLVDGRSVALTRREFDVLAALVAALGHIVPRARLYELVWGGQLAHRGRDVDVHVRKVRLKLEQAAPDWAFIHTHRQFGYRFAPEQARVSA